jgi:cell division FtsZ-interacting protein ZapD
MNQVVKLSEITESVRRSSVRQYMAAVVAVMAKPAPSEDDLEYALKLIRESGRLTSNMLRDRIYGDIQAIRAGIEP